MSKIKIFLVSMSVLFLLAGCANNNANKTLKDIKQNVLQFVNLRTSDQLIFSESQQKQMMQDYFKHYFSPWTGQNRINNNLQIFQAELQLLKQFSKNSGWGENFQKHAPFWIQQIVANMDLQSFPNHLEKAITIDNANLRLLPTDDPAYSYWKKAGGGYPFDNLQESEINANTPILILQMSQDKAWDLVLTHNDFGWVKSETLALVNQNLIHRWQHANYVAIVKDHVPVMDSEQNFRFETKLGAVFPLSQISNVQDTIWIATANQLHQATVQSARISTVNMVPMPYALTQHRIAILANSLLGNPYGWGNMYGYRDCSSTMVDLFTPFAVWLPRNSSDQVKIGNYISLENLSEQQKQKVIVLRGVPFITFVRIPGHIMLYLGVKGRQPYVFHDFWGLHTTNIFFQKGRAVLGQTIVTPLNFGHRYINVRKTLLDQVTAIDIL